jgi:hypothetical protein
MLYLGSEINARLIPQLRKLRPGARIVSHEFGLGQIPPDKSVEMTSRAERRKHTLYLWTCPLAASGVVDIRDAKADARTGKNLAKARIPPVEYRFVAPATKGVRGEAVHDQTENGHSSGSTPRQRQPLRHGMFRPSGPESRLQPD